MSVSQQAMQYYEMIRQGASPQEAFKMAFPDGIPTQEDRLREAADAQQKAGLGQVGGLLAGALGTKGVMDAVRGERVLGGLRDSVSGWFGDKAKEEIAKKVAEEGVKDVATQAVAEQVAPATPEILGATLQQPAAEAGGQVLADSGAQAAQGLGLQQALGLAGVATGGVKGLQAMGEGDIAGAGLGGLSMAGGLYALGATPLAPLAMIAAAPALMAALRGNKGPKAPLLKDDPAFLAREAPKVAERLLGPGVSQADAEKLALAMQEHGVLGSAGYSDVVDGRLQAKDSAFAGLGIGVKDDDRPVMEQLASGDLDRRAAFANWQQEAARQAQNPMYGERGQHQVMHDLAQQQHRLNNFRAFQEARPDLLQLPGQKLAQATPQPQAPAPQPLARPVSQPRQLTPEELKSISKFGQGLIGAMR